jgi:putative SOS response-associated peptidase YedK
MMLRMCGRFTLTARDIDEAARAIGAEVAREYAQRYRPRWNIAPTDSHWIVRLDGSGNRRLVPARFGFERPDGQLVINARSDGIASTPSSFAARQRRSPKTIWPDSCRAV